VANLQGKVAVVLGASASKGTGWAIAEALAGAGAKVVVGARSLEPLQRLADKIGGTAVRCDVSNEKEVAAAAQAALDTYGKLDIAVNAAGLAGQGLIDEAEENDLRNAVENNYFANVYFVKHMARAIGSDGSITIISSLSTTHPMLPLFSYACAKAATDCLAKYAALEYGPRNIRVNTILPGPIMSDMTADIYAQPGYVEALEREIPLKRIGYPNDFADAVLWLAGGAYVTGLNIPVCGGIQLARFPFQDELPGMKPMVTLYERGQS
jgi:NAD(P)-dependent dehydrogenase (short-subunit alcohol dehydrogenase family)